MTGSTQPKGIDRFEWQHGPRQRNVFILIASRFGCLSVIIFVTTCTLGVFEAVPLVLIASTLAIAVLSAVLAYTRARRMRSRAGPDWVKSIEIDWESRVAKIEEAIGGCDSSTRESEVPLADILRTDTAEFEGCFTVHTRGRAFLIPEPMDTTDWNMLALRVIAIAIQEPDSERRRFARFLLHRHVRSKSALDE